MIVLRRRNINFYLRPTILKVYLHSRLICIHVHCTCTDLHDLTPSNNPNVHVNSKRSELEHCEGYTMIVILGDVCYV